MSHHDLKSWPAQFNDVCTGRKTFEYRVNDRDYKLGDTITLHCWKPVNAVFTGETFGPFTIQHILTDGFGLPHGFCVISIPPINTKQINDG